MKKLLLALFLFTSLTKTAPNPDYRAPSIAALGGVAALAGIILILEKYKDDRALVLGIAMLAAGFATVIAAEDIIKKYDTPSGVSFHFRW